MAVDVAEFLARWRAAGQRVRELRLTAGAYKRAAQCRRAQRQLDWAYANYEEAKRPHGEVVRERYRGYALRHVVKAEAVLGIGQTPMLPPGAVDGEVTER